MFGVSVGLIILVFPVAEQSEQEYENMECNIQQKNKYFTRFY